VARAIHAASARGPVPFVALNAATITPERMEIELFGTESNGGERKVGALEEAHGGTSTSTRSPTCRARRRQDPARAGRPAVQRVGGTKRVKVDVRIISSTAQNLEAMIAEGRFREDLFHRLAVVPVACPAGRAARGHSRSRRYFMEAVSRGRPACPRRIGDDAMAVLQAHDWPGNVRQLRNNIER
jgi:two-component system nitrogen regulation response regulator NtrX